MAIVNAANMGIMKPDFTTEEELELRRMAAQNAQNQIGGIAKQMGTTIYQDALANYGTNTGAAMGATGVTPKASTAAGSGATLPTSTALPTGTASTGQTQQYTAFGKPAAGFKSGMSAQDRAAWGNIAAKYAAGDKSWNQDANQFRTEGNWSSYLDANGNVNGWLYAANGVGTYTPVFGGKVGESGFAPGTVFYGPDGDAYTMAVDGSLVKSGTVNWMEYGKPAGAVDGGLHGALKSSNGQTYDFDTAPDEVLANHGYVRGGDGLVRIAPENKPDAAAIAAQAGLTPETVAQAQEEDQGGRSGTGASGGRSGAQAQSSADQPIDWQGYIDAFDYGPAPEWEGTEYEQKRDAALQKAENMRWRYDPDTDPVWQAYRKQYRREGSRAMQDTLARAAAMTGGVPSSYAVTAASQAENYYASQLSDKLPQVYQDSYNRWLDEYEQQLGLSEAYGNLGQTEYDRYMDRLGQYNTDRKLAYGVYRDEVSDAQYDREWAQKLIAYADEQNWKKLEWAQYLREYGDKLSRWEREWAYQQMQDAG